MIFIIILPKKLAILAQMSFQEKRHFVLTIAQNSNQYIDPCSGRFQNILWHVGYVGHFKPKPDSPCIHLPGNGGPDGCAIFYKQQKFQLTKLESKVLEIWGVPSNQVLKMDLLKRPQGFGAWSQSNQKPDTF
jgi:hypothetical protein